MDLKTYITTGERGRATKLAIDLGVSPSYLSQMASGTSAISPERGVLIEQSTMGEVTRKEMFPKSWSRIWPELLSAPTPQQKREPDPGTRTTSPSVEVEK